MSFKNNVNFLVAATAKIKGERLFYVSKDGRMAARVLGMVAFAGGHSESVDGLVCIEDVHFKPVRDFAKSLSTKDLVSLDFDNGQAVFTVEAKGLSVSVEFNVLSQLRNGALANNATFALTMPFETAQSLRLDYEEREFHGAVYFGDGYAQTTDGVRLVRIPMAVSKQEYMIGASQLDRALKAFNPRKTLGVVLDDTGLCKISQGDRAIVAEGVHVDALPQTAIEGMWNRRPVHTVSVHTRDLMDALESYGRRGDNVRLEPSRVTTNDKSKASRNANATASDLMKGSPFSIAANPHLLLSALQFVADGTGHVELGLGADHHCPIHIMGAVPNHGTILMPMRLSR